MTTRPTDATIGQFDYDKLSSASLDFYSATTNTNLPDFTFGTLISANQVDKGDGTFFPLTASNKRNCVQYLKEVNEINWSYSFNYDSGNGRIESASESGTNYLAPFGYIFSNAPSVPGIEHRRNMMDNSAINATNLRLFSDDLENTSVIVKDAVTVTFNGNPRPSLDLVISFSLFNSDPNLPVIKSVAHDSDLGEYYPAFTFGSRRSSTISNVNNSPVGTATIEGLGSCILYGGGLGATVTASFTATIASRFTDP